jgi:hypothetical protein
MVIVFKTTVLSTRCQIQIVNNLNLTFVLRTSHRFRVLSTCLMQKSLCPKVNPSFPSAVRAYRAFPHQLPRLLCAGGHRMAEHHAALLRHWPAVGLPLQFRGCPPGCLQPRVVPILASCDHDCPGSNASNLLSAADNCSILMKPSNAVCCAGRQPAKIPAGLQWQGCIFNPSESC